VAVQGEETLWEKLRV